MRTVAIFAALALFTIGQAEADEIDDTWKSFLTDPPKQAVDRAAELQARADSIASSLSDDFAWDLSDIDVVVSGGGNFDAFYIGAQMVMSRLSSDAINIARFGGVSAGGMVRTSQARETTNSLTTSLTYHPTPLRCPSSSP